MGIQYHTRRANDVVKTQLFKTETETETQKLSLETSRDIDLSLENYITAWSMENVAQNSQKSIIKVLSCTVNSSKQYHLKFITNSRKYKQIKHMLLSQSISSYAANTWAFPANHLISNSRTTWCGLRLRKHAFHWCRDMNKQPAKPCHCKKMRCVSPLAKKFGWLLELIYSSHVCGQPHNCYSCWDILKRIRWRLYWGGALVADQTKMQLLSHWLTCWLACCWCRWFTRLWRNRGSLYSTSATVHYSLSCIK